MRYEKENSTFTGNESFVSALEYTFLISRNNSLIKIKRETLSRNSRHYP